MEILTNSLQHDVATCRLALRNIHPVGSGINMRLMTTDQQSQNSKARNFLPTAAISQAKAQQQ